jgi:hypothetical protein
MPRFNELALIAWLAASAFACAFACAFASARVAHAQGKAKAPKPARTDTSLAARLRRDTLQQKKLAKLPHDSSKIAAFYAETSPLAITLTTNIKRLRDDKSDKAPYRAATLSYVEDGRTIVVPARVRTRGIWRLKTCDFPPLRVNFTSEDSKKTVFRGIDNPKLVSYCQDTDTGEQYVLQEFQLYRIYRLLTPASHAPRLVRMTYADSASGKPRTTRYAVFTEDPDALAARLSGRMLEQTGAGPNDVAPFQSALVGVFNYLIGNTDFAISALHNAEVVSRDNGELWPVVYDFDFAGAVNARYATPDPRLGLKSVRDRLYRGYCVPPDEYPKVFAVFNDNRDAIYALYRDEIGRLLRKETVDATLRYFDEFYRTINNPRMAKEAIVDGCLGKK